MQIGNPLTQKGQSVPCHYRTCGKHSLATEPLHSITVHMREVGAEVILALFEALTILEWNSV